jgi:glucose-6-phosphate 1-dehydrogenase
MEPFVLIIFGVTGNLAKLKLIPVLYDLEQKNLIPAKSKIIGIARHPYSSQEFGSYINEVLHSENRHHLHETKPEVVNSLLNKMVYINGDFGKKSDNFCLSKYN